MVKYDKRGFNEDWNVANYGLIENIRRIIYFFNNLLRLSNEMYRFQLARPESIYSIIIRVANVVSQKSLESLGGA